MEEEKRTAPEPRRLPMREPAFPPHSAPARSAPPVSLPPEGEPSGPVTLPAPEAAPSPPDGPTVTATLPPSLLSLFPAVTDSRERARHLLRDGLSALLGAVFAGGHLAFGVYPFGIALLMGASERLFPLLLGVALGSLALPHGGAVYAALSLLLFALRFALTAKTLPFGESRSVRVALASLGGAALAVYELLLSGPSRAALFFSASALLAPPLFTLLFTGIRGSIPFLAREGTSALAEGPPLGTPEAEGGHAFASPAVGRGVMLLSLGGTLAYCLGAYTLLGLSLGGLFLFCLVFLLAKRRGALLSSAVGLLFGLLPGVAPGALYAPAYALSGLLFGLLSAGGGLPALFLSCLLSSAYGLYAGGLSGLLGILPEVSLSACLIYPFLPRLSRAGEALEEERDELSGRAATLLQEESCASGRRERVAEALSTLSRFFGGRGELAPTPEEYREECRGVLRRLCADCSCRHLCWEGEGLAEAGIAAVSLAASMGERLEEEKLPQGLRDLCPAKEKILEEIADACARHDVRRRRGDHSLFLSEVYAFLGQTLLGKEKGPSRLKEKEALAREVLTPLWEQGKKGRPPLGIAVTAPEGGSPVKIALVVKGGASLAPLKDAASALGEALGLSLSPPECIASLGEEALVFEEAPRFFPKAAVTAAPHPDGEATGDSFRHFLTEDGVFYALLSDGEGRGESAHATSSLAALVLESLLSAGLSPEETFPMLNSLLRETEEESSAALDLFSLDLYSGRARIYKSGAAPSYIKRGRDVYRIRSKSLPLGILKEPDAEQIALDLKEGDALVLFSDGLAPDGEDPMKLLSVLSREEATSPSALSRRLVAEAVASAPPADDATAAVICL